MSRNFEKDLAQASAELIPSMLNMLRSAAIANPEKQLL